MFDIGWSELLVIAVVALIAIGPKELPGVLRNVGHWMGKIRGMAAEFQSQFREAMREAEMEDLKKHADDLNTVARTLTNPLDPTDYLGKFDTPSTASSETAPAANPETTPTTPAATTATTETLAAPAAEPDHPPSERAAVTPASGTTRAGGGSP
jgi:sec-independent protein translocase protein TatB